MIFSDITLEDNAELRSRLAGIALPKKEYFEIETEEGHSEYSPPQAFC